MEHEIDSDANCNWCTRYSHQTIGTRTGGLGNKRTSRDYSIIEIGRDTSPGDLSRFAVTQTPEENHQQTLV